MHSLLIFEYIFILPPLINKYVNIFLNGLLLIKNFLRLFSCFVNIIGGEYQSIGEQYMMLEDNISVYTKSIYNVKSTLQKVLVCWATYIEKLRLLKACFEETKKEQIKEVFAV